MRLPPDSVDQLLDKDNALDGFSRAQVSMILTNPNLEDNPILITIPSEDEESEDTTVDIDICIATVSTGPMNCTAAINTSLEYLNATFGLENLVTDCAETTITTEVISWTEEEIGGFPDIVSEDLGFAIHAREKGYRGRFVEDVICYEDFPDTVRAFRIRHMKWTRGTSEFLSKMGGWLLRAKNITWAEKLDILFPTLSYQRIGP